MKTLFISILLILGLGKSLAQSDSLPISVTIKVDKEYVQTYSKKTGLFTTAIQQKHYVATSDSINQKFFDISLEIKNTSDRSIKIWLMTCSWEDNFITNNNYISFIRHECDSNFPTLVEFKAGESKVYKNTIAQSTKFHNPCESCINGSQVETTKLGLIVIDDVSKSSLNILSYDVAMKDKSKWKMVWSNPLFLFTKDDSSPKPIKIPVYQNNRQN